jgi:hypothetical protein
MNNSWFTIHGEITGKSPVSYEEVAYADRTSTGSADVAAGLVRFTLRSSLFPHLVAKRHHAALVCRRL